MNSIETSSREACLTELVTILDQQRGELAQAWVANLSQTLGKRAEPRIARLREEQRAGTDLLTLLRKALADPTSPAPLLNEQLLTKLRTQTYSVFDLFTEARCLERTLSEALDHETAPSMAETEQHHRMLPLIRDTLDELIEVALRNTAEVYESVVESGSRGFCQVDPEGKIIYANAAFCRLAGTETMTGKDLAACFDVQEQQLVANALRRSWTLQRPLHLRAANGHLVPVAAEIGPLTIAGENRSSYAGVVDISRLVEIQNNIFDRSPLGITKVNLEEEFTYANPAVLRIVGAKTLTGRHIHEVFDEANYAKVREQLRQRRRGESSEYEVAFRRLSDGRSIPSVLAAVPEMDLDGRVIGAVSIARNVLLEKATIAIHRRIQSLQEPRAMLVAIEEELRQVLAYDMFAVSLHSADGGHVRSLHATIDGKEFVSPRRWWVLTDAMRDWMNENRVSTSGDLVEYLAEEKWRSLKEDPHFKPLLDMGMRYFVIMPVIESSRIVASVVLYSRRPFPEDDLAILKAVPVDQAVLVALHLAQEEEQTFRFQLAKRVSEASNNVEKVAGILVRALAEQYEWTNVAIFQVDWPRHCLRLVSQWAAQEAARLPDEFAQPLEHGVLGYVCRKAVPVNIGNVTATEWKDVFQPSLLKTISELCVPIRGVDGQVRWLLNVEDVRENAFAAEELHALETVISELATLLERSRQHHLLKAVIESTSDAIIVTDEQGGIRQVNPAGQRLLGYAERDLLGQPFRRCFQDETAAVNLIETSGSRTDRVWLQPKEGPPRDVLLSVARLPGTGDSRVFTAKDLLPYKQAERLEALERVYTEIAGQTKTRLALIYTWIKRLSARLDSQDTVDTLQKVRRQLGQLELTYDRLFLAEGTGLAVPYHEVLLDLKEIVAAVRRDLPEAEYQTLNIQCPDSLPHVHGDLYQLWFCVMTIVAYLFRFVPQDRQIRLVLSHQNDWVSIEIVGYLPAEVSESEEGKRTALAKTMADLAMGQGIITKFVENHHGKLYEPDRQGEEVRYRIDLPVAKES